MIEGTQEVRAIQSGTARICIDIGAILVLDPRLRPFCHQGRKLILNKV